MHHEGTDDIRPFFYMTKPTRRRLALLRIALFLAMGKRSRAYIIAEKAVQTKILTVRQCAELYLHLSLLLGVPTALEALARLHRTSDRWSLGGHRRSRASGRHTFTRIYGSQTQAVLRSLHAIDPFLPAWVIHDVYGGVFSRRGLGLLDREVITFTVLAYQGFDPQCHSHLRGASRLGASNAEIRFYLHRVDSLSGRSMQRFIHWLD